MRLLTSCALLVALALLTPERDALGAVTSCSVSNPYWSADADSCHPSLSAAADATVAFQNGANPGAYCGWQFGSPAYLGTNATPAHRWRIELNVCAGGLFGPRSVQMYVPYEPCGTYDPNGDVTDPNGGGCPNPCTFTGETYPGVSGSGAAPATICDSASGCVANRNGSFEMGGLFVATYEQTDQACGAEPTGNNTGDNCISTGSTVVCLDGTAQNCGTVNGEYVCLGNVPQGGCIFTPDGQAICDGGTNTETPDDSVSDSSGNDYDVYGNGLDGSGGTQSGTDDGAAVAVGDEAEQGDPTAGGTPDLADGDDWQTIMTGFYGRVTAAPIVASVSSIPASLPAGSCNGVVSDPIAALGGESLTIDAHCQLWPDLLTVIQGVMLAIWVLLGALIILRA